MRATFPFPHPADREKLPYEDKSFFVCRPTGGQAGTGAGTVTLLPARKGQVGVITRVVAWTTGASVTTTQVNDTLDLLIVDDGGTARVSMPFLCPHREPAIYSPVVTQTLPESFLSWEPQMAIVVPSGWTAAVACDSSVVISIMLFGYWLDENEARQLGFDVNNIGSPVSSHNWFAGGLKPATNTTTTLTAARSGMAFEITDIFLRMMPNNITTAAGHVALEKSDGTPIFIWSAAGDPGELIEKQIKCRIFLDPADGGSPISNGYGLQVTSTGMAGRFTINVVGRYIRRQDVPGNAWFARITPDMPSPNAWGSPQKAPFLGVATGTTPTLVKAAAGVGRCHIVEGLDFSCAKDSTAPGSTIVGGLMAGRGSTTDDSTHTMFSAAVLPAVATVMVPMTPIFSMSSHHQHQNFTLDRVNLPTPDNGSVFFETEGYHGTATVVTPTNATLSDFASISPNPVGNSAAAISITVWGRTVASKHSNQGGTTGVNALQGLPYQGS
jgi:hypothetical protein